MKKILLLATILFTVVVVTLTSCGSSTSSNEQKVKSSKTNVNFVFDVPSLIGKDIDEVKKILGKPTDKNPEPTKQQMKMNFDTWDNSFEKDGHTLLVTFNPQNREVTDFFIDTSDPSGATTDYSDLLALCNVTNDNPKYSIEPVPALNDNSKFTGIKIIKK